MAAKGQPACFQSVDARTQCSICGKLAQPVHVPRWVDGWFCKDCCPVCNPKPEPTPRDE